MFYAEQGLLPVHCDQSCWSLAPDAFCFDVYLRLAKAGQSHEAHEIEEFDPDDVADDSLPVSDESLP
jgi:hypothetical protein